LGLAERGSGRVLKWSITFIVLFLNASNLSINSSRDQMLTSYKLDGVKPF
jgi:hypothetical protein